MASGAAGLSDAVISVSAVDRFPSIERERSESASSTSDGLSGRGPRPNPSANKMQDVNHTREVIFALPSLQLHIKTEHLQAGRTPDNFGT